MEIRKICAWISRKPLLFSVDKGVDVVNRAQHGVRGYFRNCGGNLSGP